MGTPRLQDAARYAQHAELVYASESTMRRNLYGEVQKWSGGVYDRFRFREERNAQGYVAGNDQEIVIVYRGTQPRELLDVLADVDVREAPAVFAENQHVGGAHWGFKRYAFRIDEQLWSDVEEFHDNNQKIVISDHSLGAAAGANLAAKYLIRRNRQGRWYRWTDNYEVHLWGCPRNFDAIAARHYDEYLGEQTYRWVNNNDVVTRVPFALPAWLQVAGKLWLKAHGIDVNILGGARHIGQLRYFDQRGNIHFDPGIVYRTLDRVGGRTEHIRQFELLKTGKTDGIDDHEMSGYRNLIVSRTRELCGEIQAQKTKSMA